MDFYEVLAQVIDLLEREQRVSYRALKRHFGLDDDYIEDLKDELIKAKRLAVDEDGAVLVWTGDATEEPTPHASQTEQPTKDQERAPTSYTPQHLAEKILTSRRALEGERKQVTVMFADIKDSTELIRDLDPEAAQQLIDPAIHIMMDAVHRFEGTVNQVLGDGIMAIFGAPIAHEDHAARACYTALAMQAGMQPYADDVRRAHGITMRIRVGLNSGEVVVRTIGNDLHMDYSAVGQTTNLASRMEQLAAPGSITLTATTLRLVEGLVRVNDLGLIPVKGMSEPVDVYELTGASSIRRRLQAAVARGLTKFVGRDTEIEVLNQALEQAKAGNGQVVSAIGEAGLGKSRLFYEFIHSHRTQGWRVLESASVSYGKATPYFPIIDLLKRYAQVEEGDDARAIRAKLTGQVLTLDEALHEIIPALLALCDVLPDDHAFLQLNPPQRRQCTIDGIKRLLLRESQEQPLLLVFEDLHWIDSETQALLDELVESLPSVPALLLVNYRPEYQHSWGSKTYYTQLRLDPLPPESAEVFLRSLLGDDSRLEPLKQLLIERTEGNPFFLEESVRTLMETEVLVGEQGAYCLVKELPTIQVPATVQAVLAARIDRLPQDEKRLLQTAAVIGTEVPFPLLQAIAEMPEELVHRNLTHLQAAEFLYETNLFPERVYTFKHALTQNVAYQSLLTSTRQQYHQRIAEVLEAQFPDTDGTQPELLAHHFSEAGLNESAIEYWRKAGQKAIHRSANVEAISHLTKGMELLTTLPETPARNEKELVLQTTLGPALMATKGYASPEVASTYARARELCQHMEDTPELFPVLVGMRVFYFNLGELQTAYELAEQLFALAQRQQNPTHVVEAHRALGTTLTALGAFSRAREHLEQGIALHDDPKYLVPESLAGGADPMVICLSRAAEVLWFLGYPDQSLARSQEARALARRLSHLFSRIRALGYAVRLQRLRREEQAVQELGELLQTLRTEQGIETPLAFSGYLGLIMQSSTEEGIVQMRQILEGNRAKGQELNYPYNLAVLAEAYGQTGQHEAGLAAVSEALEAVNNLGERWCEAELYRLQGELLLQMSPDNQSEAETSFHQALDVARHQQAKSWELRAATSLARLWQSQGKCQDAYDLLAPVYRWFTEGFDTADLQDAKSLLQELEG